MSKIDKKYLNILNDILTYGYDYLDPNRKGVYRKELETVVINHSVNDGYPIISIRKTFFKGAVGELLLFLKGENDIRKYWKYGIEFWNKDWRRLHDLNKEDEIQHKKNLQYSDEVFSLGSIYPIQYKRQYSVFDNFKENHLRTDLIIDSWQIDSLKNMALIPCHFGFQILGSPDGFKICWFQRSTDFMLGSPINIQYYYLMGILLEFWSGHKFLGITGILNKCHLYDNQIELAKKMIKSTKENSLPELKIKIDLKLKELSFEDFIKNIKPSNFILENYTYTIDESVEMLTYQN